MECLEGALQPWRCQLRVMQDQMGRTVLVLSRDEILSLKNDQSVGGKAVGGGKAFEFVIMRDRAYDRATRSFQKTIQQAALQAASEKASEGSASAVEQTKAEPTPAE